MVVDKWLSICSCQSTAVNQQLSINSWQSVGDIQSLLISSCQSKVIDQHLSVNRCQSTADNQNSCRSTAVDQQLANNNYQSTALNQSHQSAAVNQHRVTLQMVSDYMANTHADTHNQYKLQVEEVFTVSREDEQATFLDYGNRCDSPRPRRRQSDITMIILQQPPWPSGYGRGTPRPRWSFGGGRLRVRAPTGAL